MGVGLDGEELGAQGGDLAREEAGGEEAVEAEGWWLWCVVEIGGGSIPIVFFFFFFFARAVVLSRRSRIRRLQGGAGAGLGLELRGREVPVRGDGAVDVDARGRLPRRGEPEGGLERGGRG